MTTDQTPAVEVLARLLCAVDVHVHDGDHPTWQQLRVAQHGRGQDDYRKAARWLLPRMTVATKPAAVPVPPPGQPDHRAQLLAALDFSYCQTVGYDTPEALLAAYDATQPVPPPAARATLLREAADIAEALAAIRPQTLTALASHIDARSVAILRPSSQTYAEWQAMAALLRRMAAEEQPAETQDGDRVKAIADAIGPVMLLGLQNAELFDEPGQERIRDWIKWISETVAALPAVMGPAETQDSLPAWLYQRFMPDGVGWENLDADDRSYWEHHARAVRRAVARGGFMAAAARPAAVEQPDTQTREALCRCGHGRDRHAPDVYGTGTCADCPSDEERSWRHPFTPAP